MPKPSDRLHTRDLQFLANPMLDDEFVKYRRPVFERGDKRSDISIADAEPET